MTNEQNLLEVFRRKGKESLFFFARGILGFKDLDPKIHLPLCKALEKHEEITRLMVTFPRTWFKSTICSIAYPIWRSLSDPNVRILIVQNSFSNACKKLGSIKSIFEKNKLFKALYPEILPVTGETWTKECLKVNRTASHPEGTFEAAGVGTATISRHYDEIIQDDTIAPKKDDMTGIVQQPTQADIEKAIGWHRQCHPLLIHILKSRIIIVGTRWAQRDLQGWIMENSPEYTMIKRYIYENDEGEPARPESGGHTVWSRFNTEAANELEKSEGPYMFACTPGHAKVLMDDMTSKPISDIKIGDFVVGVLLNNRKTLVRSKVLMTANRRSLVVKLKMKSGREIFCTPNHKWMVDPHHQNTRPHLVYQEVCNYNTNIISPKINRKGTKPKLHYVCDMDIPEVKDKFYDWSRWLAGFYDGEGSCNVEQGHLTLSQSLTHNSLLCSALDFVLDSLGFKYTRTEKPSYNRNGEEAGIIVNWTLNGGFEERRRFLLQIRPLRYDNIEESFFGKTRFVKEQDEVKSIENVGVETVYRIMTTTGNYISQGYISKNCLYMNTPTSAINQVFKRDWIRYYDTLGKKEEVVYCTSVDLASAKKEESSDPDYTVVLTTAVNAKENKVYVVHYTRGRFDPGETVNAIFDHVRAYKPLEVIVESIGYQRTINYWVRKRMIHLNMLFYINELTGLTGSKVERIRGLQPYFAEGRIVIKPHMNELEQELLAFPKGSHDDLADALCMQIRFWYNITESYQQTVEEDLRKDPFTGASVIEELQNRVVQLKSYPYDVGCLGERYKGHRDYSYN